MVTRRNFLNNTLVTGLAAFVTKAGCLTTAISKEAGPWLKFNHVASTDLDSVTVPKGFKWHIVISWGDPLWHDGQKFDHHTRGTAATQELAFGDNNDGMSLFEIDGHTVLVVNHEYVNNNTMFGNRRSELPEGADDVHKSKLAHGVSVLELVRENGHWVVVKDSRFNRRITANTPMKITGAARGHDLLKTDDDPYGITCLGTWSNCGSGRTPWGTYLSCEENFNYYFATSRNTYQPTSYQRRYGIKNNGDKYAWISVDSRFDISKNPNESNRSGYVVEIDPGNPQSTPKKRTSLGRFKHENAEVVVARNGHIVVYSGDDEVNEHLYKFVSKRKFKENSVGNADLLDDGVLYAAKFNEGGRGYWIALTPESTGMKSHAEICIHTRQAASAVGATKVDRPEWVAVNPTNVEVYCCLTDIKYRGKPNLNHIEGRNPRLKDTSKNMYGQIVRWTPDDGDHAAVGFEWDVFVAAGNPTVYRDDRAGSMNINALNMFNFPDGLAFDTKGGLWIQTDGDYSDKGKFSGHGNNQMLFADTITGEIKRFMVGPRECEITGITWSPDLKTMFVGIQHPGERGGSHFPGGEGTVPRSSIIAISREDGGAIG